jgi:hypothetical protein
MRLIIAARDGLVAEDANSGYRPGAATSVGPLQTPWMQRGCGAGRQPERGCSHPVAQFANRHHQGPRPDRRHQHLKDPEWKYPCKPAAPASTEEPALAPSRNGQKINVGGSGSAVIAAGLPL